MSSNMEYLECCYDARASFNQKAIVQETEKRRTLLSYLTEVAFIENGKAVVLDDYSSTTLRHIKEFLKQNGFKAENKKQIFDDYSEACID